jgi:5-methyltetrahydropteroyltriglutamate--homocysteine methyltransferase
MIQTTVVGSWPPAPEFVDGLTRYFRRQLDGDEAEDLLRSAAAVAIRQQRECGLDEYTGGETSADSFILHFPRVLAGIAPTEDRQAWDGRGAYRVVGPLSAPSGLGIAAAYRREQAIDPTIAKVTIPGPSEITMMIVPEDARRALWPAAIDLIRAEIQACIDLGAADIQLDAPHIAMGLVDHEEGWDTPRAVTIIRQIFDGLAGIRRSVHFCYGDFGAQSWTDQRDFHSLLPTIQALDGVIDRLVLEFSLPEQWAERALLADIPESMEIAAGIVDVKSPNVETPEQIEAMIYELLDYVPGERLLICPSCGFGRRHVEMAMSKTRAMVRAVQMVNQKYR